MKPKRICVLGGTGFLGSHLVCELTRRRIATRVLTRRRERHRDLLVFPGCELVETDVHSLPDLSEALKDCDVAINLVGVLNSAPGRGLGFRAAHEELPAKLAEACQYNRIGRLLHVGALRASPEGPSDYLRSKAAGEEAAHSWGDQGVSTTSFRPSVIYGQGDSFFNRFASLLAMSPGVFPLACPAARFAPVYVGDVVEAMLRCLHDDTTVGGRYDLCGPREYTLQELVEYTAEVRGLRRWVIGLGSRLSRAQARLMELVPGKPFSEDNYRSLQVDSVCQGDDGFAALGMEPLGLEAIVPTYLGMGDRMARLNGFRAAARRG
jgi:NADH dehydrogenase